MRISQQNLGIYNNNSTSEQIWNTINKITGCKQQTKIIGIYSKDDTFIQGNEEIADEFAYSWSNNFSDSNFSELFRNNKIRALHHKPTYTMANNTRKANKPITTNEFEQALTVLKERITQ